MMSHRRIDWHSLTGIAKYGENGRRDVVYLKQRPDPVELHFLISYATVQLAGIPQQATKVTLFTPTTHFKSRHVIRNGESGNPESIAESLTLTAEFPECVGLVHTKSGTWFHGCLEEFLCEFVVGVTFPTIVKLSHVSPCDGEE